MSFVPSAFAARPLRTREEVMSTLIDVAAELDMPDVRAAAIIAGITVSQEAGSDPHGTGETQFWCPGNQGDPAFAADPARFPHDSLGDDGLSTGYFQQQMSRPGVTPPWGWGGLYGDPEGTRKRMDLRESARLFLASLKRNPYRADNRLVANQWAQKVQGSGRPDAYAKHFDDVVDLYNRVAAAAPPPNTNGDNAMATWTGDPTFLEDVLRPALGGRLKTLPGWQDAGHGDFADIRGVMVHHTGNSRETAQSIRTGRPDLAGPLANLHIGPDGTVTIVAVGVCWHAGQGSYPWLPTNGGNQHLIGIECAWPDIRPDGTFDEHQRWPDAQIVAMRDTCAALAVKLGVDVSHVIGHKEYAGAVQGKWDPGNLDMNWFRGEVAKKIAGVFDKPNPAPPTPQPGPILPPNYEREVWDQLRIEWPQLGHQTLVNAIAEIRDKVCGTSDKDKR